MMDQEMDQEINQETNQEESPVVIQAESLEENQVESLDESPAGSLDESPEEIKAESLEENQAESLDESPVEIKAESLDESPIEIQAESLEESPVEIQAETLEENQVEIKAESLEENQVENLEKILEENQAENLEKILEENPIENLEDTKSKDSDFLLELDFFDDAKQEDRLWQARTGLDYDSICGAIETIIFMSDRPISINKIKTLIDPEIPLRVIHESIGRLQTDYEVSYHGIRLVEVAEGYQFRTKATFSKYVQDLFKVHSLVLTPSALEVLAIISYKQPCPKTDVEKIRGVDSSHIIRALMDKRLVKITGRSEELGKPTLYGTTKEFLEVFNLRDLSELPPEFELESLANQNDIGDIGDIKNLVNGKDKKFFFDEIDELDKLTEEIRDISPETEFTKSLKKLEKNALAKTITSGPEEDGSIEVKAKPKTAFEVLEEYITLKEIKEQNKLAAQSTPVNPHNIFPVVIKDLTAGPFNAPEEDGDDFEMIDLDTGEPISLEEEKKELEEALDDAFTKLTGEELSDELDFKEGPIDNMEDQLSQKLDEISKEGKDLDLDLDFLKD